MIGAAAASRCAAWLLWELPASSGAAPHRTSPVGAGRSEGKRCQWFSETEVADQIPNSFFLSFICGRSPGGERAADGPYPAGQHPAFGAGRF